MSARHPGETNESDVFRIAGRRYAAKKSGEHAAYSFGSNPTINLGFRWIFSSGNETYAMVISERFDDRSQIARKNAQESRQAKLRKTPWQDQATFPYGKRAKPRRTD